MCISHKGDAHFVECFDYSGRLFPSREFLQIFECVEIIVDINILSNKKRP